MEIVYKKLDEIRPYENNPRFNDSAVDVVMESIREFGFKVPMVIDSRGEIVTGHTRFEASKRLGLEEVPCIVADDLTEEQVRAFRLADNKTAEFAEWDEYLLELEMLSISEIDLERFGFYAEDEPDEPDAETVKRVKAMEIRAFEHHDYLVFVFQNQQDWLAATNAFGIERVDAGYGKTKKVGVGRVLNGKRLLEKI